MRQDGTIDLERLATATWQMASMDKEQNIIGMNSIFGETATNTLLQLYGATKLAFAVMGFLKSSSMPRDIELVETIHLYYELEDIQ